MSFLTNISVNQFRGFRISTALALSAALLAPLTFAEPAFSVEGSAGAANSGVEILPQDLGAIPVNVSAVGGENEATVSWEAGKPRLRGWVPPVTLENSPSAITNQAAGITRWAVASSADGQTVVLGQPGGSLYVSTDGGVTFVPQTGTGKPVPVPQSGMSWGVDVSADGKTIIAIRQGQGERPWVAKNVQDPNAISWTLTTAPADGGTANPRARSSAAVSGNGQVMVEGGYYSGGLYVSRDAGATWGVSSTAGVVGASYDSSWSDMDISHDGKVIVAARANGTNPGVYVSVDSGVTFTRKADFGAATDGPGGQGWGVAISGDASTLVVTRTISGSSVAFVSQTHDPSLLGTAATFVEPAGFASQGTGNNWVKAATSHGGDHIVVSGYHAEGSFWASTDGGKTWDERPSADKKPVSYMALSAIDPSGQFLLGNGLNGGKVSTANINWDETAPPRESYTPIDYKIQYTTENPGNKPDEARWTDYDREGTASLEKSRVVTGLTQRSDYWFRVSEVNGNGQGEWSAPVRALVGSRDGFTAKGATPQDVVAIGGEHQAEVSWGAGLANAWEWDAAPQDNPASNSSVGDNFSSWAVASSADGRVVAKGQPGGRMFLSTDAGKNFVAQDVGTAPAATSWAVDVSADGRTVIVGQPGAAGTVRVAHNVSDANAVSWAVQGGIPAMTNAGTWSSAGVRWEVASSANGQVLVVGRYHTNIFVSRNGGATWSTITNPGNASDSNWFVDVSADGRVVAAARAGGGLYISTDSGVTFTQKTDMGTVPLNSVYTEFTSNWSLSLSDDGTTLAMVKRSNAEGSQVLVSRSADLAGLGTTGSLVKPTGAVPAGNILNVSVSGNGQRLVASGYSARGGVWLSVDGGISWSEQGGFERKASSTTVELSNNGLRAIVGNGLKDGVARTAWVPGAEALAALANSDYRVQYTAEDPGNKPDEVNWKDVDSEGSPSLEKRRVVDGLDAATQYWFRVAAVNVNGRGSWSLPGSAYTVPDGLDFERKGVTPHSVSGSAGSDRVEVKWNRGVEDAWEWDKNPAEVPGSNTGFAADRSSWSIASSLDGRVVVKGQPGGRVFLSTDAGKTFHPQETLGTAPQGLTWGVNVSGDGRTVLVGKPGASQGLWLAQNVTDAQKASWEIQTNKGVPLTGNSVANNDINPTVRWDVASSLDGQTLIAARPVSANSLTGPLYVSRNAGASWAPAAGVGTPPLSSEFWSVAISDNGQVIVAAFSGGGLYVSTNGGVSFATRPDMGTIPANTWLTWGNLWELDLSGDGRTLAVVKRVGASSQLLVSRADSPAELGTTASLVDPQGFFPGGAGSTLGSVSVSRDGSRIIAGGYHAQGSIWASYDRGSSWTEQRTRVKGEATTAVALSGSGRRVITGNGVSGGVSADAWLPSMDERAKQAATGYRVQITSENPGENPEAVSWQTHAEVDRLDLSRLFTGLNRDTQYWFRVAEVNSFGPGEWSSVESTRTDRSVSAPIEAPSGLSARGLSESADVRWKALGNEMKIADPTLAGANGASGHWSTATSEDGRVVIMGQPGGKLYVSTNFGRTYTEQAALGSLAANLSWGVDVSGDGRTLIVGRPAGNVWVARDVANASNVSWQQQSVATFPNLASRVVDRWAVASSHDGNVLAVGRVDGTVTVSRDGGRTWANGSGLVAGGLWSVDVSADGRTIVVARTDNGGLYVSEDAGATFSARPDMGLVAVSGVNMGTNWDVALSGDAKTLAIVKRTGGVSTLFVSRAEIPSGLGTTASLVNPSGLLAQGLNGSWLNAAISFDGQRILVGGQHVDGFVWESVDHGQTWSTIQPFARAMTASSTVAISSNGWATYIGSGVSGGRVRGAAAPADGGSPVTGYALSYSAVDPEEATEDDWISAGEYDAETLSRTIDQLAIGTTYWFRVAALNEIGRGVWSAPVSAHTYDGPSVGLVPQGVRALGGDREATVSWSEAVRSWSGLAGLPAAGAEGEWAVSMSDDGRVIALGRPGSVNFDNLVYVSTDAGVSFGSYNVGGSRYAGGQMAVAVSGDGQTILVGSPGANGYVSLARNVTDGSSVVWESQIARGVPATGSYVVTGSGWEYSNNQADSRWRVAVSGDGSVLVAAPPSGVTTSATTRYNRALYVSRDGGASWVEDVSAGTVNRTNIPSTMSWAGVDISRDGSRIVAARYHGSANAGVYVSEGGGAFQHRPDMGAGDVRAVSLSGDGRTLMVVRTTGSGAGVVSRVFVSRSDALAGLGTAGSLVDAEGFQAFSLGTEATAGSWVSVDSSYDGSRLVVGGRHYTGAVWTSDNNGQTWNAETRSTRTPALSSVAISADGWKVLRADGLVGGHVEISTTPADGGSNPVDYLVQYTDQDPSGEGFAESSWTLFEHEPSPALSQVVTGADPRVGLASDTVYWFRVAQVNSVGVSGWSEPVFARTMVGSSAPGGAPQNLFALGGDREATVSWSEAVRSWSGLAGLPAAGAEGEWAVSMSDDGRVIALGRPGSVNFDNLVYVSTDAGVSFGSYNVGGSRYAGGQMAVAVSGDGQTILVGSPGANGYVSLARNVTDGSSVVWESQIARGVPATGSYVVTGSGWEYSNNQADSRWRVAVSGDGSVLVAAPPSGVTTSATTRYNRALYVSRDGGASWVEDVSAGTVNRTNIPSTMSWAGVDISRDGSRIVAARYHGSANAGVYVSEGGGAFQHRPDMGAGDVRAVSLSGDGRTLMVVRTTGSGAGVVSRVFVSRSDALAGLGTAGSLVDAEGFQAFSLGTEATAGSWVSVDSSYDGSRLVVGGRHYTGAVWTSDNNGQTWNAETRSTRTPALSSVAISADGWKVLRADGLVGGHVEISTTPADGGSNPVDYLVQYTDQDPSGEGFAESSWTLFEHEPSPALSQVVTGADPRVGLASDTVYWFRVAQVNSVGVSGWSEPVFARTMVGSSAPGGAPQNLFALGGDREATVSWSEAVRSWSGLAGLPAAGAEGEWAVSMSDDGRVIALGRPGSVNFDNLVYVSTDAGVSFGSYNVGGSRYAGGQMAVAVSGDGQTILVGSPGANGYVSLARNVTDGSSVVWESQIARGVPATGSYVVTGSGWEYSNNQADSRWRVAVSGDGSVLVAAPPSGVTTSATTRYNRALYVSRDGGASWVEDVSAGTVNRTNIPSTMSWAGVDISRDGSRIVAARYHGSANAGVYVSEGGGAFQHRPDMGAGDVRAVSLSGDGRTLMVVRTTGSGAGVVSRVFVSRSDALAGLGTAGSLVDAEGFQAFSLGTEATAGSWVSVDSSYDGSRLVVGGRHYTGAVWTSDNNGQTWSEQINPAGTPALSSVAVSAEGWRVLKANGLVGGVVEISTAPAGGSGVTHHALQYTRVDLSELEDGGASLPGPDTNTDPLTGWMEWVPTDPITGDPGQVLGSPETVLDLTNNRDYWFRVAAANSYGTGPWGGPVKARPMGTPDAPTNLETTSGDSKIDLNWEAPENNGGFTIVDYVVQYRETSAPGADASQQGSGVLKSSGILQSIAESLPGEIGWKTFEHDPSTDTEITVTDLMNGQWYEFRVAAVNDAEDSSETRDGRGPWNTPETNVPGTKTINKPVGSPTAPRIEQNQEDVVPGDEQVTLNWRAPLNDGGSDLVEYTVEICQVPGGENPAYTECTPENGVWTPVPATEDGKLDTARVVGGLINGTPYWFRITVTNDGGFTSPESTIVTATPRTTASAPVLTGRAGDGEALLSWTQPESDGGDAITEYSIRYSTDGGVTWQTHTRAPGEEPLDRETLKDQLTNGTEHWFQVAARNGAGLGEWSNTLILTPAPALEDAPVLLEAEAGDTEVKLTWEAPENTGGSALTGYLIEYSADAGVTWDSITVSLEDLDGDLSYTVGRLTNGTEYSFRVSGMNTAGVGPESNVLTATPVGTPDAPVITEVRPGDTEARVTWTAPSNTGGAELTYYVLQVRTADGEWADAGERLPASDLSTVVTKLSNGTEYEFRVAAVNAADLKSEWSEPFSATPIGAPDADSNVTDLAATPGNTVVDLVWTAPEADAANPVQGYIVKYRVKGILPGAWTEVVHASTDAAYSVTGLTNGTQYEFQVVPTNTSGSGNPSNTVSATPIGAPGEESTVTDLAATPGDTVVDLKWSAPEGSLATGYVVKYRATGATEWIEVVHASKDAEFTVTGLTNGTEYEFVVVPTNASGSGNPSNTATATPIGAPDEDSNVTNLAATPGDSRVDLVWTAPDADAANPVQGYVVKYRVKGVLPGAWTEVVHASTDAAYTVTGLTNGTEYEFVVVPTNTSGAGNESNTATATPMVVLTADNVTLTVHADTNATFDSKAVSEGHDSRVINAVSAVTPNDGTVSFDTKTGVVTYVPTADFTAGSTSKQVTFTYTMKDASGAEATGTVTITVLVVPVAVNDSIKIRTDRAVTLPVLANDTGHELALDEISTEPTNGEVTIDGQSLVYTAKDQSTASDTLVYVVRDSGGRAVSATVTLQLQGVPTAQDSAINAGRAGTGVFDLAANSAFSSIADLANSEITVSGGVYGTVSYDEETGLVTYTANAEIPSSVTEDTFTYTLTDDLGQTVTKTVTVTLVGGPVTNDTVANTSIGTAVQVDLTKLFANAELVGVTGTLFGEVSIDTEDIDNEDAQPGVVTYTPETGFTGHDAFVYTVRDAYGQESSSVVRINVYAVPQAHHQTVIVPQDVLTAYNVFSVDEADEELPTAETSLAEAKAAATTHELLEDVLQVRRTIYAPKTLTALGATVNGETVIATSQGVVHYTPFLGNYDPDEVEFTVTDELGLENSDTVLFEVQQRPSVTGPTTGETPEGGSYVFTPEVETTGSLSDIALANGPTGENGESGGSVVIDPDTGTITFEAGDAKPGDYTFTVEFVDDLGQRTAVTYTVTVVAGLTAHDQAIRVPVGGSHTFTERVTTPGKITDRILGGGHSDRTTLDGTNVSFDADGLEPGVYTFDVTYRDDKGMEAAATYRVTVQAPPAGSGKDFTVRQGTTEIVLDPLSDAVGVNLQGLTEANLGAPGSGKVRIVTGPGGDTMVAYIPEEGWVGTTSFTVTVYDDLGQSVTLTYTVTVTEGGDGPQGPPPPTEEHRPGNPDGDGHRNKNETDQIAHTGNDTLAISLLASLLLVAGILLMVRRRPR
ncbi:fibronectin type III domain-containing protein [Lysinibacter sp. HNR]|uniref:fibronectin type III domain-containing protein n=1 Tax=Lysinibacter sp. HNR TaxID=3031408 RepID=UPI0024353BBE|nr:fibronectin type III domain-containing protein [Lysinibacter sp. HNR]WGD37114.1 fibronectin type III domain-containing protein [Lysinibacter sp. HNR]